MASTCPLPRVAVLVGSPRRGSCLTVARAIAEPLRSSGVDARLLELRDYAIGGCVGCGACSRSGACVLDAAERGRERPGFAALLGELFSADALVLVAPVYFAGPPSQLKAAFDRMQPLWARRYLLRQRPVLPLEARKPLELFVLGGSGDPFGFEGLVTSARSALRMADFELRGTHDLVGFETRPELREGFLAQARDAAASLGRSLSRRPQVTDDHPGKE